MKKITRDQFSGLNNREIVVLCGKEAIFTKGPPYSISRSDQFDQIENKYCKLEFFLPSEKEVTELLSKALNPK